MRRIFVLVLSVLGTGLLCAPGPLAAGTTVTVSGKANVFAAGRSTAFDGVLPPAVRFPAGPGRLITFTSVTGTVIASATWTSVGPDGNPWPTDISSYGGIAGIRHPGKAMFLAGVFLTDSEPADPASQRLDFSSGDNFASLSPPVGQNFLVGDGLTGTGSGSRQQFHVPPTATRLFLGFAGGYNFSGSPGNYSDNGGALTAVVEVGGGTAGGNLLVNGSFEQPGSNNWSGLGRGSTYITGWVVTRDTVDYQSTVLPCSHEYFCLDLDGTPGFGAIAQTFATAPGASYTVAFDLGGNPDGPPTVKQLRVSAAGQQADFSFDTSGRSRSNMGWTTKTWSFTASSTQTTLEFASLDTTGGLTGPLLDNVRVTAGAPPVACTYTISPASAQAAAGGGTGSVAVTAASGCAWMAASSVAWVTITAGANGTGNGTVSYSVAANAGASSRTGTLTVAGQTFTVTQGGASANLLVNGGFEQPAAERLGLTRGSTYIPGWVVTRDTVDYQTSWFTCPEGRFCLDLDGNPGAGAIAQTFATAPGARYAVGFVWAGNMDCDPVVKRMRVSAAGQQSDFTFDTAGRGRSNMGWTTGAWAFTAAAATTTLEFQSLDPAAGMCGPLLDDVRVTASGGVPACSFSITPSSASMPASGGSSTVSVVAAAGCAWNAASNAAWIALSGAASGSGNGAVTYRVAENTATAARTGTLTIAGQTFTLTQGGAPAGPRPAIQAGGVVNTADLNADLAPGMPFAVLGTNLAARETQAAQTPLPTSIEGVSVEIVDGSRTVNAPLFAVSPGRIDAQMPVELTGRSIELRVRNSLGASDARAVALAPYAPRLITKTAGGKGEALAWHADRTPVTAEFPAQPGEVVTMYAVGLGAVSPPARSGWPGGDGGSGGPKNQVVEPVSVRVGGRAGVVRFAGLVPGEVGRYAIEFEAPLDAEPLTPAVVLEVAGVTSQASVILPYLGGLERVAAATVGRAGGTLAGGTTTLTVPAEAWSGDRELRLFTAPKSAAFHPDPASGVYALAGLPEAIPVSLTVSADLAGPTPPEGDVYLVLKEAGFDAGVVYVKATVEGNRATATLPPRKAAQYATQTSQPLYSRAAEEPLPEAPILNPIYLMFISGIESRDVYSVFRNALLPTVNFEVVYPKGFDTKSVDEVIEMVALRFKVLKDFGLMRSSFEPFMVWFGPIEGERKEEWGDVSKPAWTGEGTLRIDPNCAFPRGGRTPSKEELRAKVSHLLAHLGQDTFDLRSPAARAERPYPWLWMDEAVATWFETQEPDAPAYTPDRFPVQALDNHAFLIRQGLEFRATADNVPNVRAHGYGAYFFVRSLDYRSGMKGRWSELYQQRAEGYTSPLVALARLGLSIPQAWQDFCRSYFLSDIVETQGLYTKLLDLAFETTVEFRSAADRPQTFSFDIPDLSARLLSVRLEGTFSKTAKIRAQVLGGAELGISGYVVAADRSAQGGSPSVLPEVTYPAEELATGNLSLILMVINSRAVPPYASVTPATLKIWVDDGPDQLASLRQAHAVFTDLEGEYTGSGPAAGTATFGRVASDSDEWGTPVALTWEGERTAKATAALANRGFSIKATFSEDGRVMQRADVSWELRSGKVREQLQYTLLNLPFTGYTDYTGANAHRLYVFYAGGRDVAGQHYANFTYTYDYDGQRMATLTGIKLDSTRFSPRLNLGMRVKMR